MSCKFGYIDYNPLFGGIETGVQPDRTNLIEIDPTMVQCLYRRIFDVYCGMFVEKQGEFLSLVKMFNGDYRRAVISIETSLLEKETTKMEELFKTIT